MAHNSLFWTEAGEQSEASGTSMPGNKLSNSVRINKQVEKFVSNRPDPDAFAVDAFSLDWNKMKVCHKPRLNWLCPHGVWGPENNVQHV
eukprot:gene2403-2767_t